MAWHVAHGPQAIRLLSQGLRCTQLSSSSWLLIDRVDIGDHSLTHADERLNSLDAALSFMRYRHHEEDKKTEQAKLSKPPIARADAKSSHLCSVIHSMPRLPFLYLAISSQSMYFSRTDRNRRRNQRR